MKAQGKPVAAPIGARALAVVFGACSQTPSYRLHPGPGTPAAEGIVKVSQSKNQNEKVNLKVEHFPRPVDLGTGTSQFVVWIEPPGQQPMPVGELTINDKREGTIQFITLTNRLR